MDKDQKDFQRRSLYRLSVLLDCGLTEEQLNACMDLLDAKLCNPEALAVVINRMKEECRSLQARRMA